MSNTELSIINNTQVAPVRTGGMGISANLFAKLKPATLSINQPNTQVDGAIKGHLRINETGQQFDKMRLTLLVEPTKQRQYYIGEKGQLNRQPENLMCFSTDCSRPHPKAKDPQALKCFGCQQSDWTAYREDPRPKAQKRDLIPNCDEFFKAMFIDTHLKMPLQSYFRGTSKQEFDRGLENLVRHLAIMSANGKDPNIFDVSFTLTTKRVESGKTVVYVPVLSDFSGVTPEERQVFAAVFEAYASRGRRNDDAEAEDEAAEEVQSANDSIDSAATGPVEGEYLAEKVITI